MVFFVDHRKRLPLLSAITSAALLALPMALPILCGIRPRHARRFGCVVVDVNEAVVNANACESYRNQRG